MISQIVLTCTKISLAIQMLTTYTCETFQGNYKPFMIQMTEMPFECEQGES